MSLEIDSPLTELRGIGPVRAGKLATTGLRTVRDLLHHLPFRYEDRRQLTSVGEAHEEGTFSLAARVGELKRIHLRRRGLSVVNGWLEDETGRLPAVWFNRPYLIQQVKDGEQYLLHGRVRRRGSRFEMVNPSCEPLSEAMLGGRIVAIYNSVGGLGPALVRRLVRHALDELPLKSLDDEIPSSFRRRHDLPCLGEALLQVHRPDDSADVGLLNERRSPGHRRLIYGEFLELQVELGMLRSFQTRDEKRHRYEVGKGLRSKMQEALPFRLTGAQARALEEILADMESPFPMLRLLQGDVGSGKTIVAALALIVAMENGLQGAFMAPTELLAEQHFRSLRHLLEPRFRLALVTGSGNRATEVRRGLADGRIQLAVGTHALIQEGVAFDRLALAVVDEQHRFGVAQRQVLLEKGQRPDMLVMTATPIPRSLALTAYGDLSLSVVDELPPGRRAVNTRVVRQDRRDDVHQWLAEHLEKGGQAYVVFPSIDDSSQISCASISTQGEAVRRLLSRWPSEVLHGRVETEERERIMESFGAGETRLLVATSIIEVGVDVPGATVMIIDSAERFGLAQLHQLRGRVGRGAERSYCVALHGQLTAEAERRLAVFGETTDGFRIAEADLEIRGPGDLLGTRQAGEPLFRVANIVADRRWLEKARSDARELLVDSRGARKTPFMKRMEERARSRYKRLAGG
ncbi:MAG: ATP-dependent DNA helicase RecG [Thermoanaerobaculia bacterium]